MSAVHMTRTVTVLLRLIGLTTVAAINTHHIPTIVAKTNTPIR